MNFKRRTMGEQAYQQQYWCAFSDTALAVIEAADTKGALGSGESLLPTASRTADAVPGAGAAGETVS